MIGIGEFQMRNGKQARIVRYKDGRAFPWFDAEHNSWNGNGAFSAQGEESPLDIIGPWPKPGAPFTIDGPGSYVMRDGRRVEITIINDNLHYPCGGALNGKEESWMRDGRLIEPRQTQGDIVGPWVEPEPVVETCERCAQLLAERDDLRAELLALKRRVLNAVNGVTTKVKQ